MKLTNTEIQKSIAKLPDNIKQAVMTFNWAQEILDIAHEHNMQIDDADEFRHQTLLVILGETRAENYENKLIEHLGIDKNTADTLVAKANARIFLELQKRAFSKNNESPHENTNRITMDSTSATQDPYQEPIEHHEVKDILKSEGIELVEHHEPEPINSNLHNEVSAILAGRNRIEIETEAPTNQPDKIVLPTKDTQPETSYQEIIEEKDLHGIRRHRIDHKIVAQNKHENPEKLFTTQTPKPKKGRDLGQGNYVAGSFDKKIMHHAFVSKPNHINISPTETSQIKKDGEFLSQLKKES